MREYEFRLTKQSIYNSDLMLLPLGRVRANNFDQAKSKALNEARRQEILLSALVKGCKLWDRVTEKMHDGDYPVPEVLHHWKLEGDGAYQDLDYRYLACVITGDTAELRVGDAEDHKTKIDLGRHMLEYHDPDQPTNLGVAELFRSIGLRCRVMESRGVVCRGVTKKKADEVFRATAMVTSMDRRMEHCRNEKNLSAAECRKRELRFYQQGAKRERA